MQHKKPTFAQDDENISYSVEYNAYYDNKTMEWVEEKCGDPRCDKCSTRPTTPPHVE